MPPPSLPHCCLFALVASLCTHAPSGFSPVLAPLAACTARFDDGAFQYPWAGAMTVRVGPQGAATIRWGRLLSVTAAGTGRSRIASARNDDALLALVVDDGRVASVVFDDLVVTRSKKRHRERR